MTGFFEIGWLAGWSSAAADDGGDDDDDDGTAQL